MKQLILWGSLCLGLIAPLFSQNPLPVFVSRELPMPFLDKKGNVQFELPPGDQPVWVKGGGTAGFSSYVLGFNQPMNVFFEGICVVRRKKGSYYWIDPTGKILQDFGKAFYQMHPFEGGFALAYAFNPKTGSGTGFFLRPDGSKAFEGEIEIGPFPFSEEGIVPAKRLSDNAWFYMKSDGSEALKIQVPPGEKVVGCYPFSEGMARVELEGPTGTHDVLVNREGQIQFDLQQLFPNRQIRRVGLFREGILDVTVKRKNERYDDLYFLDVAGKTIYQCQRVEKHSSFSKGHAFWIHVDLKDETREYRFINRFGQEKQLPLPEGQVIYSIPYWEDGFAEFQIYQGDTQIHALYRTEDLSLRFESEWIIAGYTEEDLLLFNWQNERIWLTNQSGKIRWESTPETLYFQKLTEALAHKQEAKHFIMGDAADFEKGLWDLENLETLEIGWIDIKAIPEEIGQLTQLKKLELNYLKDLETLPKAIGELPHLTELEIHNSKQLDISRLEEIIVAAPSLRKVFLENIPISYDFINRMKQERPELEIQKISGFDLEISE